MPLRDIVDPAINHSPYSFLPVNPGQAVTDTWVRHDGTAKDVYSGELLCELTALTPLLVANQHYELNHASNDVKNAARALCGNNVAMDKKVLEPLRLPSGEVLLAGTGLKGMIRSSLAALLQAPMDKVAEKSYSYRPNLGIEAANPRLAMRPAVVTAIDAQGLPDEVKVLSNTAIVHFGNGRTPTVFNSPISTGFMLRTQSFGRAPDKHYVTLAAGGVAGNPIRFFHYVPGIDGKGELANLHATNEHRNMPSMHHFIALTDSDFTHADNINLTLSDATKDQYNKTVDHLSDREHGHLRASHPLSKGGDFNALPDIIKAHSTFQVDQLIYVEVGLRDNVPVTITSFGHHFHYRWRYRDTVRTRLITGIEQLIRPELDLITPEKDGTGLSAGRLLFGYADQDGLGEGLPKNLSGRIACNIAVEQTDNPNDATRFWGNGSNQNLIALKILGQPRASAVEFYLKQEIRPLTQQPSRKDASDLQTYGDTRLVDDDSAGQLRGRKVYRHQNADQAQETNPEIKAKNQSVLARFVSKPQTKFRFSIRFQDLRLWELGALCAVLEPHRLAKPEDSKKIHAHKLGYGRPLGLGSVQLKIDQYKIWQTNELPKLSLDEAIKALTDREDFQRLDTSAWLMQHRFQSQQNYKYPTKFNPRENRGEIFGWHSDIRKQHARLRRTNKT